MSRGGLSRSLLALGTVLELGRGLRNSVRSLWRRPGIEDVGAVADGGDLPFVGHNKLGEAVGFGDYFDTDFGELKLIEELGGWIREEQARAWLEHDFLGPDVLNDAADGSRLGGLRDLGNRGARAAAMLEERAFEALFAEGSDFTLEFFDAIGLAADFREGCV